MSAYRTAGKARWQHVIWLITILLIVTGLTACETMPQFEQPTAAGCQVRAGAVVPEGSNAGLFGSGISATGASATVVGECSPDFRVFSRYNGSVVCQGDADWCNRALENEPVELTPAQLREMMVAP